MVCDDLSEVQQQCDDSTFGSVSVQTVKNNSKQSLVKPVASACEGSKDQEVNRYKGESVLNNGGTLTL